MPNLLSQWLSVRDDGGDFIKSWDTSWWRAGAASRVKPSRSARSRDFASRIDTTPLGCVDPARRGRQFLDDGPRQCAIPEAGTHVPGDGKERSKQAPDLSRRPSLPPGPRQLILALVFAPFSWGVKVTEPRVDELVPDGDLRAHFQAGDVMSARRQRRSLLDITTQSCECRSRAHV